MKEGKNMSSNHKDQDKQCDNDCFEGTLVGVGRDYIVLKNGVLRTKIHFRDITDLKYCCKNDEVHHDHDCKKDEDCKKKHKKKPKPPKPKKHKKDDCMHGDHKQDKCKDRNCDCNHKHDKGKDHDCDCDCDHKHDKGKDHDCNGCSSRSKCCNWREFDWDKCSKHEHHNRMPYRETSNGDDFDDDDDDDNYDRCKCSNNSCMRKLQKLIGCEVKVFLNC